jgi:hypothetical protein
VEVGNGSRRQLQAALCAALETRLGLVHGGGEELYNDSMLMHAVLIF